MIYLDNCATTKPRPEVVAAMTDCLTDYFANPSSLHSFGLDVEKKINLAREQVAKAFHAKTGEVFFTSGGTESSNIAIQGAIAKYKKRKKRMVTTVLEHSSILNQYKHAGQMGLDVVEVGVDSAGRVDREALLEAVDDDTFLVSLFHVNNELGSVNPVADLVAAIRKAHPSVFIHIDGVQAPGKVPVDFKAIGCDSYAISGHKFHGPKGVGVLLLREGITIEPLQWGGGQEKGMRSGTENVPGIVGLGVAAELMAANFTADQAHIQAVRDAFLEGIQSIEDCRINSTAEGVANIVNVSFLHTRGEVLLHSLERDGIYISTASACTSNGTGKSHVLEGIHMDRKYAEGTIRICFCKDTTLEDVRIFVEKLTTYVNEIREVMAR
ncbi:cysteine desulfurase family protein [Peptoniphilus equinus]|uniref:Cysteine desulfurase family protein n=1 Tax=Peptoniphilus equinus TaxID=3016343 RepID=A0ABY7QUN0_9FIRM|nr:cysteine desulfurase family protein [Peptoniphilus equinus]WBW49735.1 cysteine desulfurase family protein [Peptoniphilus equinus]